MAARRTKLLVLALAALVLALITVLTLLRARPAPGGSATTAAGGTPRPAAGTPRGVMWDLWHAAMNGDRDGVRAAFHATGDEEGRAADAMAELLVAEAALARQFRHTWPLSPTSRDGAGTWFGEGGDAAIMMAREQIDPAAIHATVNMRGTPVKLVRAGGAWKIATADLARTKLKRAPDTGLAGGAEQLAAMAKAYRELRAEVAALRIASPSAAVEKLRQSMPAAAATPATRSAS